MVIVNPWHLKAAAKPTFSFKYPKYISGILNILVYINNIGQKLCKGTGDCLFQQNNCPKKSLSLILQ